MSWFFGQPPDSVWYCSTQSATARASAEPYQAEGCFKTSFHRTEAELIAAIRRVTGDKGVIVMTDMFGGTPSNLAINVMDETGAEVIHGVLDAMYAGAPYPVLQRAIPVAIGLVVVIGVIIWIARRK